MRVSITRLRSLILVLAGLLVTGVLCFFAYARWQARRFAHDLPGKLGISIQQSSSGFTFSKSEGGHTLFTLHAAKTVQYKGAGRTELHDVSITMYGVDGSQADRIYGNDFDYDPVNGVVRANGEVQIDLQGPATQGSSSPVPEDEGDAKNTVHVKTADLVFNQKTGFANTPQRLEFRIAEAAGSATGASFDSRTGVLILEKDVDFESSLNGSPLVVRASHAQFDRASRMLFLLKCATEYADSRSSSDQAAVSFRPNGSAFRVDAQGHVEMATDTQKITSQTARTLLDEKSQPQRIALEGSVLYSSDDSVRRLHGTAGEGVLSFGPQSSIRHAELRQAVSLVDDEKITESPRAGKQGENRVRSTTRDVEASQVDVDFASTSDRQPLAQHISAVGGARFNAHTTYTNTPPEETAVAGDRLFVTLRNGAEISSLQGTGHTQLSMLSPTGVKQTSTGDTLRMTFADPQRTQIVKNGAAKPSPAAQLQSSEQEGNVVLTQQTPARGQAAAVETSATAQRVTYDAATQLVNLYGNPHLHEATGDLTGATIQFERTSGNAFATGGVKATYRPADGQNAVSFGGSDPVHVVADHARLDHQKDLAFFFGKAGRGDARLWQGADSISAAALELSRSRRTLSAHGAGDSDPTAVKAVLTSSGSAEFGKTETQRKTQQTSVVRVISRTLLYSDAENQAHFRGGVEVLAPSGTIRAKEIDAYFSAGNAPSSETHPPSVNQAGLSSGQPQPRSGQTKQVERIVARGAVRLEQPGRNGSGEELVYTADDGRFVLTGTPTEIPRIVDQLRGTVTGASLIFNDRDDSVLVSGGQSQASTETRAPK